ncbi:MAG: sigma-54-dependent Fis family transcriptional regulator [Pseudomonadales bacterium]|nr:sigma-54-dependent Fis family transcriptional regulator [Pseudomonadales bacterium]
MAQILIVEDEAIIRSSLRRLLERHGHHIQEAGSVTEALDIEISDIDLVISDVRLPGEAGTTLIARVKPVPVLIMTSFGSVKSAVDAMRQGAVDYITKPFDHDEMMLTVDRILRERNLVRQNEALKQEVARTYPLQMIGHCAAMEEVFTRLRKVAATQSTVLILGESGTGKELVARSLHEQSPRAQGPMISVNCAAIPETLIESELFGYEKGAFTGAQSNRKGLVEAADGGTLFLDEIGELPLEAQARLLRLLQEKEVRRIGATQARKVDVRVVAATHRNLKQLAQESKFREDLYYRLNVFEVRLPPLRERGDDVLEIAQRLLERNCHKLNCRLMKFSQDALDAILAYNWPGNVRELENAIERAIILSEDDTIHASLLALDIPEDIGMVGGAVETTSLEDYFASFVLDNQDQMSETELAQKLGISRKSLWERRQRLGIPRKRSSN